jgi:uncharacterized membrane protein
MSSRLPVPDDPDVVSFGHPERLAPVAIGAWAGGIASRAAGLHDGPAGLALVVVGAAAALAAGRALPGARRASPVFLFLPLTLLPSIPGWRTLAATLAAFGLAWALDRRVDLDDPARARRVLWGAVALGGVLATGLGVLRLLWLADVQYGQDTAYQANLLANTLRGEFLRSGLLQDLIHRPPLRNDFGAHNSPLQIALLPVYLAWPSAVALIVLRGAILWSAPLLLFRHLAAGAGPRLALHASLALAAQATVLWQSASAFYFVQMSLPFLVLLLAAWERGSLRGAILVLVLLLGVREDLAVVAVALAGVALVQRRRWPWVAAPAALGLAWWVMTTRVVLPAGGGGEGGAVWSALAGVGGTPAGIAAQALRDPMPLLRAVFGPENREMFLDLAGSVGWVGLLSPWALVALPFYGINALVDFSPAKEAFMHYHLLPAPFLILGGVRLLERVARDRRLAGTLGLGLLCAVAVQDLRLLPVEQTARALRPANAGLRRAVREAVGVAASVGAPGAYLPALADRPGLYLSSRLWEYPDARPEVVVWDPDPLRANPLPADRERYRRWADEALAAGDYRLAAELPDGVVVLRRSPRD